MAAKKGTGLTEGKRAKLEKKRSKLEKKLREVESLLNAPPPAAGDDAPKVKKTKKKAKKGKKSKKAAKQKEAPVEVTPKPSRAADEVKPAKATRKKR